jgi:hypothetical protein
VQQVMSVVTRYWRPCGLLSDVVQAKLLAAVCTLIATLHTHAPRMPAPSISSLTPATYYACGHPRCFLLASTKVLLALARRHRNAVEVLRNGSAACLLAMPAPAAYVALMDDVANLFALILEHPWTVLQARPL